MISFIFVDKSRKQNMVLLVIMYRGSSFCAFYNKTVDRFSMYRVLIPIINLNFTQQFHSASIANRKFYLHTQVTAEPEKDEQLSAVDSIEQGQNVEPKHIDPSGDTSDENVVTVPTGKGGIRRKHHRAWTLSEVMKLVEGVSRYGAGRWSEIKRLAFASYSYRTSVDLKVHT